jgi:hypothetical protein
MKKRRDFSMEFDSMEFEVESLRKILELYDIHPRVDTGDCIQMKDDSGHCQLECPYISECKFFAGMCVDMVGYSLAPKKFPDGFGAHLMNSIELYKAGIDVGIVEIKPEDYEDISERY